MTHHKPNEDIIIWNPKNEKGIKINCSPLNSAHNGCPDNMATRMKYYLVQQNSNAYGRLIGTCLPDVINWWNQDLHQFKQTCNRLVNWIHNDYFLVCQYNNPLTYDSNSKYELYYWPTVDKYPKIALEIPASTKSNGDITLYLDPKSCFIDVNSSCQHQLKYKSSAATIDQILMDNIMETVITNNFVAGYDDLISGPTSGLGSRRFQRQIIAIPNI